MTIPPPPGEGDDSPSEAGTEALLALIDDLDQFMVEWVQRLNRELLSLRRSPSPDPGLQQRLHDFEHEKRHWEAMRRREAVLARERSDQLTAAWLQLETEQQRVLQISESRPSALEATSSRGHAARAAIGPITMESNQCQSLYRANEDRSSVDHPNDAHPPAAAAYRSREAAVQQFRCLREEIRSLGPGVA